MMRCFVRAIWCLYFVLCATSAMAQTRSAGLMNFDSTGSRIACTNRDSGTVSIVSYPDLKVQHEVPIGLHPEGVAWIGDSSKLACCVYGDDKVVIVDAESGKVTQTIVVFDEPYGVVSSVDGQFLFVTLEYPGKVVRIRTSTGAIDAEWSVGNMLRGLALSADGKSLFATEYLTSKLIEFSAADGSVTRAWDGASTDNLCRQVVLSPSGDKAYLTHIRSRVTAAHGNGSIFPYVSVARLSGEKVGTRTRIPMDSLRGARVTANPWDCDLSPDGKFLCVAFAGTNELYVCRITGDDHVELDYHAGLRLGNNPRAVRCSPDGKTILVYNALDFNIVAYNMADGSAVGTVEVTKNPLPVDILLGKKLFYTALQPMSSRNWISCSSCHPDGDADGRTWQQPEGLRNTQPMTGLAWTHPLHWSSDRDEVQDFEHTIRGKLMQGQGLLRGSLPEAMADKISGRSDPLDALAAYTNSHKFSLSPWAKNGLSESARRGRTIFQSEKTKCATCHGGPLYSDSRPADRDKLVLHDVGTGGDDPSELMGPKYDTPALLGVYRSAPYLHHGKAATLRDVLTTQNAGDRHGVTSHLKPEEVDDLVEFLKALPYEDPEPAAKAAGLVEVRK
ncbi:MAG: hypothetical protein U0996_12710 [Planctomycetaceae bacterium]